jgi:hypothetical protein
MKRVTATLITDGSSDTLLVPLLELLFAEHTSRPYQVNCAEGLPPLSSGLQSRIEAALDLYPCDLLLVHRDAEGETVPVRQLEIETSWQRGVAGGDVATTLVCVIPVRMTESWLITQEGPIRSAVGNPHGKDDLGLPAARAIESDADPKAILFAALKAASGLSATRKQRFVPDRYRHRVSELTEDLGPLRKLPSFRHLEAQIQGCLRDD